MVREVKRVLSRGPCTLSQIVAELGAGRELVRSALHYWIRRGDVVVAPGVRASACESGPGCGTCGTAVAPSVGPAVYEWRDREES